MFTLHDSNTEFVNSHNSKLIGSAISVGDLYPTYKKRLITDAKVHDANFAFLSTELAKLHTKVYAPKHWVTYLNDININYGGGFVDFVEYHTVNYAGILDEVRNIAGNNSNVFPRVNASMTQETANVYTFEIGYDLKFVELEKAKKLTLSKSIEQIYKDSIMVAWDLFLQTVVYKGMKGATGLFNSTKVKVQTIDNSSTTGKGFEGLSDAAVVSFFNGIFSYYLDKSNGNLGILPNRFLVPGFVGKDLTSRFNDLYTSTLRKFLLEHNLGSEESETDMKIQILSRPVLNDMGTSGKGRIVAYRNEEDYARIDVPFPLQHYITLPDINHFCYTTAFVGQVSDVQMPYETSNTELGIFSYWDFTN